jgi:predicted ABC-type ATPase
MESSLSPTYIIVAGINGVGKSSFIGAKFSGLRDTEIINADELTKKYNGDIIKGGRETLTLVKHCFEKKESFIQETTLAGNTILNNVKKAKEIGYFIKLGYIGIDSKEESIERIANRVRKGGHDIPKSDVDRRYKKRVDDFMKMLPYCDTVKLYDNDNGFKKFAGFYPIDKEGIIQTQYPQWFKPFEERLIADGYEIIYVKEINSKKRK